MENHWIEDWLSVRAESENTKKGYLRYINQFAAFCQERGKNFSSVVEDWRAAQYSGAREEQMFLDQWNDLIRGYRTRIKSKYASLSFKNILAVPKSFFTSYKIPVDVDLPRRACVSYHNQDLTREQIRMILSKATQRDRTIWLLLAESGLRVQTAIELKFCQIREDFEKGTWPLRILTPSETLKDRVGDRWSFIGEDGVKALREYLKPRLPLKDQDYLFAPEKPGLVAREQITVADLSVKFSRIARALKMEKGSPYGKPGHYKQHGLRRYFRNNMRADPSYREFWMGHSLGVDAHYISRDPEEHRKRYAQGYEQLRILEPTTQPKQLLEIQEQLQKRDQEIQELREKIEKLEKLTVIAQILPLLENRQETLEAAKGNSGYRSKKEKGS
jgi:integrase